MDWFHIKNNIPSNGQEVLGYDPDIGKVSIYTYRESKWHYRDEDHFWSVGVTWWAPVPPPPSRKARSERGAPEYLVLVWDAGVDSYVVARNCRTAEKARKMVAAAPKVERAPFVAQRLEE